MRSAKSQDGTCIVVEYLKSCICLKFPLTQWNMSHNLYRVLVRVFALHTYLFVFSLHKGLQGLHYITQIILFFAFLPQLHPSAQPLYTICSALSLHYLFTPPNISAKIYEFNKKGQKMFMKWLIDWLSDIGHIGNFLHQLFHNIWLSNVGVSQLFDRRARSATSGSVEGRTIKN